MRSAILLPPYRRMKRSRPVFVAGEPPAGTIIRQQVHVQDTPAATRAEHRRLFRVSVILDHVDRPAPESFRQMRLDHDGPIRRSEPAVEDCPQGVPSTEKPVHSAFLSANSRRPSNGVVSPDPTDPASIGQIPSSGSVMSSMLARLKITLAYSAFGSSRKG